MRQEAAKQAIMAPRVARKIFYPLLSGDQEALSLLLLAGGGIDILDSAKRRPRVDYVMQNVRPRPQQRHILPRRLPRLP